MKTWEMIKEITENPKKRFENKDGFEAIMKQQQLILIDDYEEEIDFCLDIGTLENDEWVEIKESVSWKEAFEAGIKGKKLKPEGQHLTFPDFKDLGYILGYLAERPHYYKKILLDGWHIED